MQFILTEPTKVAIHSTDATRQTITFQKGEYTGANLRTIGEEQVVDIGNQTCVIATRYGKTAFGKTILTATVIRTKKSHGVIATFDNDSVMLDNGTRYWVHELTWGQ